MGLLERLQAPFRQDVEPVERSVSLEAHSGSVDEIDPPDDIDQLHEEIYEQVGIVAANIDQYVADVFEPGVRVQAESDDTEEFFEEEFLPNCGVIGGERRQPFEAFAPITETQRLTRGTALVNLIPDDRTTAIPDTEVSGFYHIPPETVTALTERHKNILLPADDDTLPADIDSSDLDTTRRDEVAAYGQFEDSSILGERLNDGFDRETIYFSQTDIAKATYDVDIGGDGTDETGIWGRSILRPIAEEAAEYEGIKRDRATSIKTKAHGIWVMRFAREVLELPNGNAEVTGWDDTSIDDVMNELEGMGPGDVLEIDGPAELDRWTGEVPDVDDTLMQLVDDILAPLPAPKYAVGFETDINQFVTEQQETRYEQTVQQGRRYQENFWTGVFRTVAASHGLDADGLRVKLEPRDDESPVMSLSDEQIDRIETWASAFSDISGDMPPDMVADTDELLQIIMQLPEDALRDGGDVTVDESDPEVQAAAEELQTAMGDD